MAQFYVWAIDRFLSGWGHAEGKTHIQVAECDNRKEVEKMMNGFGNDSSFGEPEWSAERPEFNPKTYTATYRAARKFTIYD
jgi:hypothetical protein